MESDPFSGDVRRMADTVPALYRRRVGNYRVKFFPLMQMVSILDVTRRTTTTYRKRGR